jgi:Uma2 family endonuclease
MDAGGLLLTYQDYAGLPDDGRRYELHDGALSVKAAPGTRHQRVSANLFKLLQRHIENHQLGEILYAPLDVILAETTVLQPDLVYLDRSSPGLTSERGVEGAPALVVEILSPSTRTIDRVTKPVLYARHGVPYFWLVDPEARTVEAFQLQGGRDVVVTRASGDGDAIVPPFVDLSLRLADLWV